MSPLCLLSLLVLLSLMTQKTFKTRKTQSSLKAIESFKFSDSFETTMRQLLSLLSFLIRRRHKKYHNLSVASTLVCQARVICSITRACHTFV